MIAALITDDTSLVGESRRNLARFGIDCRKIHGSWDEFAASVVSGRPDLVLLHFRTIEEATGGAWESIEWALGAMELKAVVIIDEGEETNRYRLEMETDLEYFLARPLELDAMSLVFSSLLGREMYPRAGTPAREPQTDFDEFMPSLPDLPDLPPLDDMDLDAHFAADRGAQITREEPAVADDLAQQLAIEDASAPLSGLDPNASAFDVNEFSFRFTDTGPTVDESPEETSAQSRPTVEREPVRFGADNTPPGRLDAATVAHNARTRPRSDESAEGFRQASLPQVPPITVKLPPLVAGDLSKVRVLEVLHGLTVVRSSGRLRLTQSALRRELAIFGGQLGYIVGEDDSASDRDRLFGTMTWSSGSYVFEPTPINATLPGFRSFGEPLQFIFEGVRSRFGMNETAMYLTPFLKLRPVVTDQVERLEAAGLKDLVRLLEALPDDRPFEQGMMATGRNPEEVLVGAFFGELTKALVFQPVDSERGRPVVTFERSDDPATGARVQASPQPPPRRRSTSSSAISQRVVRVKRAEIPDVKAHRAAQSDAQRHATDQLRTRLKRLQQDDPYQSFALEPGCGDAAIRSRFYELVQSEHPDRYAHLDDALVTDLANQVFMQLRKLFSEIQRLEAEFGRTGQVSGMHTSAPKDERASGGDRPSGPEFGERPPSDPRRRSRIDERRRAEMLKKLRARNANSRASGSHRAASSSGKFSAQQRGGASTTNSTSTVGAASSATPASLYIKGRRLVGQGKLQSALVAFEQARAGGEEGPVIDAYILYTKFALEKGTAQSVLRHIDKHNSEELREYQQGLLWMLRGHVERAESEFESAVKSYARAVKLDRGNDEAARWIQRTKKLQEKKANSGFLNKLLNTKITLGGKK